MKHVAIVTGASSGIGVEVATLLSKESKGPEPLEIWLVARREDRLQKSAAAFSKDGAVCRVFALDLIKPESIDVLEEALRAEGATLRWLVNNAGFGFSGTFEEQSAQNARDMIDLNVTALTVACRRFLPFMEKGSRIVNIASSAGFAPLAGFAVYAATKAYVLHLSLALSEELKPRGITVSAVCPGPVDTEFFETSRPLSAGQTLTLPKAFYEKPADTAFLAVEKSAQGKALIVTGFASALLRVLAALLPKSLFVRATGKKLHAAKLPRLS